MQRCTSGLDIVFLAFLRDTLGGVSFWVSGVLCGYAI